METKYEEKFIVINTKIFEEMKNADGLRKKFGEIAMVPSIKKTNAFITAVEDLQDWYKILTGKELNNKYYVCNQDEPYAQKVIDIILEGESNKIIKSDKEI